MQQVNSDPAAIFIQHWKIYQTIIESDYMNHHSLGAATGTILDHHLGAQDLRVLDLGCGDAHQLVQVLNPFGVKHYTGIDLSPQALKIAEQNLSALNSPLQLITGKMEEEIERLNGSFNFIYSSFALHHLIDEKKKAFIQSCFSNTSQGGVFILIDIKRQALQTTEAYRSSYATWINNDWHALNAVEKSSVISHLYACDFPVAFTSYRNWAIEAGFEFIEEDLGDDPRHGLLAFKKP